MNDTSANDPDDALAGDSSANDASASDPRPNDSSGSDFSAKASARLALALQRIDGVGRVTTGRLLSHFASYDALLAYPREQVLARIQGAPHAEDVVRTLFDRDTMQSLLAGASDELDALAQRRVDVLTAHHPSWPAGVSDLPRGERPVVLYVYGHLGVWEAPTLAAFARPPLPSEAFEKAQDTIRVVLGRGVAPVTAAATGFDVVVHKLSAAPPHPQPSLLVAGCGMGRIVSSLRPTVSQAVHAGGALVSPFPMAHGPFDHDDRQRASLQAAIARAALFVAPRPDTPEWHALEWAVEAGRPVFGIEDPDHPLPPQVHPLREDVDVEWLLSALQPSDQ